MCRRAHPRLVVLLGALAAIGCANTAPRSSDPAAGSAAPSSAPSSTSARAPQIPGTRVRMLVEGNPQSGAGFLGYMWPEGGSIMVSEIPGPYSEVNRGFSAGEVGPGMTVIDSHPIEVGGCQGSLYTVLQGLGDQRFHKQILVCGDETESLLVSATCPEGMVDRCVEPMLRALQTVEWDRSLTADPAAVLGWTVDAPEGMQRFDIGMAAFAFSETGQPNTDPGAPLYLAIPSQAPVDIDGVQELTEAYIHYIQAFREPRIESSSAFAAGWEVVVRALDTMSELELRAHVVLVEYGDGYVSMVGIVRASDAETWLPRFRAAAASWRQK